MHLFYTPDICSNSYTLNEEESKHCIRVLRLKKNDIVYLIDGKGGFYTGSIFQDNPKSCIISIIDSKLDYGKKNFSLQMAVAPTKNMDRFEWFLEKATEIGVDVIYPIVCEHSERTSIKLDRLNKVIVSAAKQSLKAYVPKLMEAMPFHKLVQEIKVENNYIAHCKQINKEQKEKAHLKNIYKANQNALILIGPEGDFSEKEIKLATTEQFTEITLGNARLRTETAAIIACHTINLLNE